MARYDLAGKTVLITGAAQGIGFETARIAYRRGASVSVIDLDSTAAEAAAEKIGDRAIGIGADVVDAEEIETAVNWTRDRLGRALRGELAAHGASATTAYFGYVKTDLVSKVFDDPIADRFRQEIAPSFLTKQITVGQAAGALVKGIEKRAPRVIEPGVWRPPFYLRGILGPLSDRRLGDDPRVGEFVHEIEARDMGNRA